MASTNPLEVLEVCQISPSTFDSPESVATEISLPLTLFDIYWLKLPPVERIFFYELTEATPAFFNSVVLPKLKHSVSLTLSRFLPLAGNLVWPSHETKPIILYTPNNGVSLTVAQSNADFNILSGNKIRGASESHPYIPQLLVSDSKASVIALQITSFPNQGFCIGINANHATLDGKSTIMFMKAWAHICKLIDKEKPYPCLLPEELTPLFDRRVIQDSEGVDMVYLDNWLKLDGPGLEPNTRSLKPLPRAGVSSNILRATFEFSRDDLKKLRAKVLSQLDEIITKEDPSQAQVQIHLSTFVLVYSYIFVCLVKAKGIESGRKVSFGFTADCRGRLEPPMPENYFGNGIIGRILVLESATIVDKNGVASVAKVLSDSIRGLENGVLDRAKERLADYFALEPGAEFIGVAGSNRFEVYGTDFGWGKPKKVEITSINGTASFSIAESKDGSGGIEVGLALNKHEMAIFDSLFVSGLKNYWKDYGVGMVWRYLSKR